MIIYVVNMNNDVLGDLNNSGYVALFFMYYVLEFIMTIRGYYMV